MTKDMKRILGELRRKVPGIRIELNRHGKVVFPGGQTIGFSLTPSSVHAHKNFIKDLKKYANIIF